MKVLIINVVCGIGSTGTICSDLALELEKNGHEVKIAYGREKVPESIEKYAVRIGNNMDIYFHVLKSRIFDSSGFGSIYATKKFIKWVKDYNPDVINIHNIHGYYINIKILFEYLRCSEKKIIWTLHDCWAFSGHSALCDGNGCYKWEHGCGKCPQRNVYPRSFIDASKHNWIRKKRIFTGIPNLSIIVPSNWLARCVSNSFLREYPTTVINNGVNTEVFRKTDGNVFRKKYHLEDKFIILGVASSWEQMKGFEDYIALSKKLDSSYKVLLVGVSDKMKTEMHHNLLTLGKTGSISELVDIYSSADVFLNLTYCDTYPTVNLEARVCELPIITYNTGGSPEAAGPNSFVVNRGDFETIVLLLNRIKETDTKEKSYNKFKLSEEERKVLDKRYSIKKYFCLIS